MLIETFVETPRFTGALYEASGWIHVGTTQGGGRYDRHTKWDQPKKDIWLRPYGFAERIRGVAVRSALEVSSRWLLGDYFPRLGVAHTLACALQAIDMKRLCAMARLTVLVVRNP